MTKYGVISAKESTYCARQEKFVCKQFWTIYQGCSCVQCAIQTKLVYSGASPCLAHVELSGADLSPSTQGTRPPPSQVTGDSVYFQPPRRMNLVSVHSWAAQSGTCSYRMRVCIVLYFSSGNTVFWNTTQMVSPRSTDCFFVGLINHTVE
jgi:hypothetical protein